MGCAFYDALARIVRRHATGGGHVTRRDVERVHDETWGIGPGPSGCRDGVGTGVERVITTSYRDTLRSSPNALGGASPMGTWLAPRLQAREGVRARQVLLDVGMVNGSGADMVQGGSIMSLKEQLDEALRRCGDGDSPAPHKTRAVSRLQNGGILMELDGTPVVDWFVQDNIWKQFLEGLPPGIVIKHRNFHVVVHYIPLTFRLEKEVDLWEVEEANRLQMGNIVKARWCKPVARHSPRQTCGHAVFSFHLLEAANWVLTQGLFVCQKKVYAEKCKKEPL